MTAIDTCTAFAPATVANFGPGFDLLGLALEGAGDRVTVSLARDTRIQVRSIVGDDGLLPLNPQANTASIAARSVLEEIGVKSGLIIDIEKGLPIGSGLGSSAVSAVAAALATNSLFGSPLKTKQLIEPCLKAEAYVSGRHADNIAPALLGGLCFVRSLEPLDIIQIHVTPRLKLAVVTPKLMVETKAARSAIPAEISTQMAVENAADLAGLLHGLRTDDFGLISRCLNDRLSTPQRQHLVPGGKQAMEAALSVGALGAAMSGAGPSYFALCTSAEAASQCVQVMGEAFESAQLEWLGRVSGLCTPGGKII